MKKNNIHVLDYVISASSKTYATDNPEIFKSPMYYDEYLGFLRICEREKQKEIKEKILLAREECSRTRKKPRNLIQNYKK